MMACKPIRILSVLASHWPLQPVSVYLLAPVLTIVLSVALVYVQPRVLTARTADVKSSGQIKRRLPQPPKPPVAAERNLKSSPGPWQRAN
jgi:hypothetical protein